MNCRDSSTLATYLHPGFRVVLDTGGNISEAIAKLRLDRCVWFVQCNLDMARDG
jgi:hypothetical protein